MLTFREITSGYGSVPVLHGVEHDVPAGEVTVVLGRNGAGKTTLLHTVAGRLPVTSGAMVLAGEDITRLRAHERAARGIAYVPQGREIFPRLTVEENLLVAVRGARLRDFDRRRREVLERFPALAPKMNDRGGSLSGGQQQILAIARALITTPRVLLLDEPSEGIQPSIVADIARLVAQAAASDALAVLVAEQNLEFVERVCTHVSVMDKGTFVDRLSLVDLRSDRGRQHDLLGV